MKRPSHKELFGKLRDAKAAIRNADVLLVDPDAIAEDAIELGYDIGTELLEQASVSHYAGSRPPQRAYKKEIEGLELFPFVFDSLRFRCRVYVKFALSRGSLWLVSLHQDRPIEESL